MKWNILLLGETSRSPWNEIRERIAKRGFKSFCRRLPIYFYICSLWQHVSRLSCIVVTENECSWCPPPASRFKLYFDVAIFLDYKCSAVGVIIQNGKGEVMRAMSTKGPWCLIVMK